MKIKKAEEAWQELPRQRCPKDYFMKGYAAGSNDAHEMTDAEIVKTIELLRNAKRECIKCGYYNCGDHDNEQY